MVTEFGMSEKLGPLQFGQAQGGQVFVGRDIHNEQNYSDAIAYEIDMEIQRIIKEGYERAEKILREHRDKLELMAQTLLEVETLDADQIKSLYEKGKLPDRPVPTLTPDPNDPKVTIQPKDEGDMSIKEERIDPPVGKPEKLGPTKKEEDPSESQDEDKKE